MNRITVDSSLKSQLDGLDTPVEVVDETGRKLGHFVPTSTLSSENCPYSAEELARMHNEQDGRSLADIWKSLGAK